MKESIEVRLTLDGRESLAYTILPGTGAAFSDSAPMIPLETLPPCKRGYFSRCSTAGQLLPIISYLKDSLSTDQVALECTRYGFHVGNTLPSATAGFMLSFMALAYTPCPCFSKYRYVVDKTRMSLDPDVFFFVLFSSSAINQVLDGRRPSLEDVLEDVRGASHDISDVLKHLISYTRSVTEKDAMLNAIVNIFNLNQIIDHSLDRLVAELGAGIQPPSSLTSH